MRGSLVAVTMTRSRLPGLLTFSVPPLFSYNSQRTEKAANAPLREGQPEEEGDVLRRDIPFWDILSLGCLLPVCPSRRDRAAKHLYRAWYQSRGVGPVCGDGQARHGTPERLTLTLGSSPISLERWRPKRCLPAEKHDRGDKYTSG